MSARTSLYRLLLIAGGAACADPVSERVPDTAITPPLLLPWAELSGRLAYVDSGALFVADAHTRKIVRITQRTEGQFIAENSPPSFAPDGRRIAVQWVDGLNAQRKTRIFDAETGVLLQTVPGNCLSWLADGRLAYFDGYTLKFNDVEQMRLALFYECPAVAANGRHLVYSKARLEMAGPNVYPVTTVQRVELATGAELQIAANQGLLYWRPALSRDGQMIAHLSSTPEAPTGIRVVAMDGTPVRTYGPFPSTSQIAWSPDRRHLLVLRNGAVARLDLATGIISSLIDSRSIQLVAWGN